MERIQGYGTFILWQTELFNMINKYIFSNKEFFSLNLDYFNHTNKNFKYKFSGKPNQSTILNNNI